MNSALWRLILCLLLLALPVACGDDKKDSGGGGTAPSGGGSSAKSGEFSPPKPNSAGTSNLPAEIADLLPQDTILLLYSPSADEMSKQLTPLMNAMGENEFDPFDPFTDHPSAGQLVDSGQIPRDRPLALGLSISMAGGMPQPVPTIILPVKDEAQAKAALSSMPDFGMPQPNFKSGYVSLAMMPSSAPLGFQGPSLPGGAVAVHIDLATVVQQMRPLIEMGLGMMQMGAAQQTGTGMDAAATQEMIATMVTMTRQFIDSADTLSLGVAGGSKDYALNMNFKAKAGSPLAAMTTGSGFDLFKLAGSCDLDQPMALVMGGDPKKLFNSLKPFLEMSMSVYPPEVGQKFTDWMDTFLPMTEKLDGSFVMSGGMGSDGVRMTQFAGLKGSDGILKDYLAALEQNPLAEHGVSFEAPSSSKVGGQDLYKISSNYDMAKLFAGTSPEAAAESQQLIEAMYGEDGPTMQFSEFDQKFAFWIGNPKSGIESSMKLASRSPSELPAEFNEAIAQASGAPMAFAMRVELTQMIRDISALVEKSTGEAEDLSPLDGIGAIPVYSWGKGENGSFDFGASIPAGSLQSLFNLVQAAQSMAPPMMPGAGGGF